MVKLVKGREVYPFITGDDVIITKGDKHPGKTVDDAIKEVDDVLDEHKKEIDKLKSNVKYIYSYGGVGGTGSGGSGGGGGSTGKASLFISLGGHQLQNGGNTIVFSNPGQYQIEGNVSNSNGETFYVTVGYGNKIDHPDITKRLNIEENRCRFSATVDLRNNGEILVMFYDSEYAPLASIRQRYIVNPHTYDMKFKYEYDSGGTTHEGEFGSSNEYFIGDLTHRNPFIDLSFKIDLPNVTNVSLTYSIGDTTDGQGIEQFGSVTDITNNHFKIYLDQLHRNGKQFTDESNTGSYNVSVTLNYSVDGTPASPDTKILSPKLTLIPGYLYINVRNPQDLLYDSLEDILQAIDDGVEGVPEKNITVGTYTSFYCKIYEGAIKTDKMLYPLIFESWDLIDDDDNPKTLPAVIEFEKNEDVGDSRTGIVEQVEMAKPISVAFQSPGIKKLVFSTVGQKTYDHSDEKPVIKYIYVKESDTTFDWYPSDILQDSYYFRANLGGTKSYSENFPRLSSGTSPFEMSETNDPVTLSDERWSSPTPNCDTTIISFGMQYSVVNNDGAKILETFSSSAGSYSQVADVTLYSDKLFSDTSKKICIPTTNNFDKSASNQYHLVQIVRYKIGYDNQHNPLFASYLYIDGKLESNKPDLSTNQLFIGKIVLNNVNVIYNLISIQYVNFGDLGTPSAKYTVDGFIYQYYLAYKQIMYAGEVTDSEKIMFNNISDMKFDGENVIVPSTFLTSVSPDMPIPTMMMEYTGTDVDDFVRDLFKGYPNGDDKFEKDINLYWCDGLKDGSKSTFKQLTIPTITNEGMTYSGGWKVKLQGTSTMRNRIKNFSLIVNTRNTGGDKVLLMSPNYDATNPNTFLPESVWTLKADIADSAHANNTAVGMFVNHTCTRFSNNLSFSSEIKPFIKNTLEGFPILMYIKVGTGDTEKVYYLGVYNFNMGRDSYYNLGYHTSEDTTDMVNSIQKSGDSNFAFSVGAGDVISTLAIGEVQENFAQFDFHQYDDTVLFQPDGSDITRMFGKDKKITAGDRGAAKNTLRNFVRSVAKAGTYCFANIGKYTKSSKSDTSNVCVDRYSVEQIEDHKFKEYVPDIAWQFHYEGNQMVWEEKSDITFDTMRGNIENLLQCISKTDLEGVTRDDYEYLDFTSASEYYTICMAFGLVDSILKNMNIKSWNGKKCYIAFYDMDCAFGENNAGGEDVSYLAATDFWHSNNTNGYVEPVDINYDYWDNNIGKGFDYPSSYLFAIAKYAQAILSNMDTDNGLILTNYPQQFWAKLRQPKNDDNDELSGQLCNADYFMNKYFSSGIGKIPAYLASLNYQVKYLYKGTIINDEGVESEVRYLANESSFNGTRIEKVKTWLNKRLHFLDVMFNVQNIGIPIGGGYNIPSADSSLLNNLSQNTDIIVLSDMFSTQNKKTALMSSNALNVDVYAPMNTPFIINRGSSNEIFLLCAGTDMPNSITVNVKQSEALRFLGSKEFSNLSMVEPFLTDAYQIVSNNIEEIKYGGNTMPPTAADFNITSTSVKYIKFDIPTLTGRLVIDSNGLNGQAIHTLDISRSGLYGSWSGLRNLQTLKIASINNPTGTITVSDCPLVGENCVISGTEEKPTTLNTLRLTGVSGKFKLQNTKIQTMNFDAALGKEATLEIRGDTLLSSLTVSGFKSIVVTGCPNLETLMITDIDNVCEKIIIDIPEYTNADGTPQKILKKFNSDRNGVFDFRTYDNLKVLGVSGCSGVEVIKIPNHKVSIDSFKSNMNLEFIDTTGANSIIEITQDSTFWKSPKYGMWQSWASTTSTNDVDIRTLADNTYTYDKLKRTKMCVSADCTSLAGTFNKTDSSIRSSYISETYTNEWGQKVNNGLMRMNEVAYFINNCVGGVDGLDDAYIDDNYIIHDRSQVSKVIDPIEGELPKDRRANIESFNNCFNRQIGIVYDGGRFTLPDMSAFTSLNDISMMYYGTGVKYMSASLLNLPDSRNNNDADNKLAWNEFIGSGDLIISKDALKHISYRITDLSIMTLTVKDSDPSNYNDTLCDDETEPAERLNVVDILFPKKVGDGDVSTYTGYDENDEYIPFTRIESFNNFSINPVQWVDYTHLFELCPKVKILNSFLNTDLSRAKIDKILKPCTNLNAIIDSFNHTGSMDTLNYVVDLFEFFNWESESLFGMSALFTTSSNLMPGFAIKKRITQANFERIMNVLHNYTSLERLSNLFSFCTIEDYQYDYEIKLGGRMPNIKNIDALFYQCWADNVEVPLRIRRSFFENLPNVVSMSNTFANVYFDHMPSYDFFCKRTKLRDEDVFYGSSHTSAKLRRYGYSSSSTTGIYNMYNCFGGAKFENCKCWFDISDGNQELIPETDVVIDSNGNPILDEHNEPIKTYYKYEGGRYVEYQIIKPYEYSDTFDNYTNYSKDGIVRVKASDTVINNHSISNDLVLYHNDTGGDYPYAINDFNIYPTYCCLPPDIFYACRSDCELSRVFSNTNIVGVIPQHLLKNCSNSKLNNMFMNVNIMPNLIYHYDKDTANDTNYLEMIQDIPVDNSTIMIPVNADDTNVYTLDGSTDNDAVVLFRNSKGELRRRYPITDNEYSKSQFVYVPQGYTTNSNLDEAFTFRYNLPDHVDMYRNDLEELGIFWPEGDYFDENFSPDNRPDLWPYYVQYFLTADESISWKDVYNMNGPFITDGQDTDFYSKRNRVFSTSDDEYNYKWWSHKENVGRSVWDLKMDGYFNSFLNLCGQRDVRTGKIKDCGCMLSIPINRKNSPKVDNFISGSLVVLLNGRVFDVGVEGGRFTSQNASTIIQYNLGFGRNIILPQLKYIPSGNISDAPKVLIAHGSEISWFYNYMFPDTTSRSNYQQIYNITNQNLESNSDYKYHIVNPNQG